MDNLLLLGIVAGTATTVSFLPQAIKVHRTRNTTDLSLLMFAISVVGLTLWLIYGVLREDLPLIIANSITLALAGYILVMKIRLG